MTQRSLKAALSRTILVTSVVITLIAMIASGVVAFLEAQENQDELLYAVSTVVRTGNMINSGSFASDDEDHEDETLVVRALGADQQFENTAINALAPGIHTLNIEDHKWRLMLGENNRQRYYVAQNTSIRDDAAKAGALMVFLPAAGLLASLLLAVPYVLTKQFKQLDTAAQQVKLANSSETTDFQSIEVPAEVQPFMSAISGLLRSNNDLLKKQQHFIADAAHELRTPIAALVLQSSNLERADSSEDFQSRKNQLTNSIERLQRLVVQLLDLTRLKNKTNASQPIRVSLNELVSDVISESHSLAEARNIDMGVVQNEQVFVYDIDQCLIRLIRNAIENAIKFSPVGGNIDISITTDRSSAVLRVDDSGPGITSEDLPLVFEPFHRSADAEAQGTGLGLSICREISSQLDGQIKLVNRERGGLSFLYQQPAID